MITQTILNIIDTNNLEVIKIKKCFYIVTRGNSPNSGWRSAPTYCVNNIISDIEIWKNIYISLKFNQAPLYIDNKVIYIKGFPLNTNTKYKLK